MTKAKQLSFFLLAGLFFALTCISIQNDTELKMTISFFSFSVLTFLIALLKKEVNTDPFIALSGGKLTHDKDPRNLSFKIYLPIILLSLLLLYLGISFITHN